MSMRRRCTVAMLRTAFFSLFLVSVTLMWLAMPQAEDRVTADAHSQTPPTATTRSAAPATSRDPAVVQTYPHLRAVTQAPRPDFFLGRVIGNALPPRHHPNRTLSNIQFILEHEVSDPRLQKHWVLNRILDPTVEADLIALLEAYGANYSRIPFIVNEYAAQPFALFDEDDGTDQLHAHVARDLWNTKLLSSSIYDTKNLYAMSINHARNAIINLGIAAGARWVLPWDQNCYLTPAAWATISADLDATTDAKYVVTWMDRLRVENDVVLAAEYTPDPWEEPQIIFRRDAIERFDEGLRYGRRDKAALLVRLQVPGVWFTDWGWSAWERRRTHDRPAADCSAPPPASGYVVRLFSGQPMFEAQANGFHREIARADAVTARLQSLEARAMVETLGYTRARLALYDASFLVPPVDDCVLAAARRALESPQPRRAAERRGDDEADRRRQFDRLAFDTAVLAMGFVATGDDMFATEALMLLHASFIQEESKMPPVPGADEGTESAALLVTQSLPVLCDALRLLEAHAGDLFTIGVSIHVSNWMKTFLSALLQEPARRNYFAPGVVGLSYELQVASLAAYINDPALYRYHASTVQSRLLQAPVGDAIAGLRQWMQLASLSIGAGVDLWAFATEEKPALLCAAVAARVMCCNAATTADATCQAQVANVTTIFERGWDLLPRALVHCPELQRLPPCATVSAAAAEVMKDPAQWRRVEIEWRQRAVPPFPDLWQD
ncbi:hypothetical protein ACHHYP_10541 [Achlya hypogyna]|uniref:Alginate lyase domain-containing protein n=1 Tax=Achlya hypogyna TaxID=1202772 RepID=A0A1V9YL38_ACHHY|nr:hypothetical protein ACHHYP_10541 [Achlya hypogyna]